MSKRLEFFFDVGSPFTYLAYTQLPTLTEATGAEIVWRPMLLGGVFKATGNVSPIEIPPKGAYMGHDLIRWAARLGVPFKNNPHFPIMTIALMRGAVVAQEEGDLDRYLAAVFPAIWVEGENMNEIETVAKVLTRAGFDAAHYGARLQEQPVKDKLRANTEEAVSRGVFGAPTFFVGADMFWGQDRLDFVAQALKA